LGKVAVEHGMKTLRTVGLTRAREGTSTLEQVLILTSAH
jgi:type II secretory ATPase GspE/PulE/Tfp pilus assembly ATPase PilB-like protein